MYLILFIHDVLLWLYSHHFSYFTNVSCRWSGSFWQKNKIEIGSSNFCILDYLILIVLEPSMIKKTKGELSREFPKFLILQGLRVRKKLGSVAKIVVAVGWVPCLRGLACADGLATTSLANKEA